MKRYGVHILVLISVVAIGIAHNVWRPAPPEITTEMVYTPVQPEEPKTIPIPDPEISEPPPPEPIAALTKKPALQQEQQTAEITPKQPDPSQKDKLSAERTRLSQQKYARERWRAQQAKNFERQQERLNQEADQARRERLINQISHYVRVNTLDALDWAMSLEDPEEQRLALEAINKNALTGIGARIEQDENGFPKISETTIMSAVGSTGLVEPGDYIVGIKDSNGDMISFENLPMQQIVNYLRGQPGTDVMLMMERASKDENGKPQPFDVPVQRSLIVMPPTF